MCSLWRSDYWMSCKDFLKEGTGDEIALFGGTILKNQIEHKPHNGASIEPYEPDHILVFVALELSHAVPHSRCLNEDALKNIYCIFVTRDTSH